MPMAASDRRWASPQVPSEVGERGLGDPRRGALGLAAVAALLAVALDLAGEVLGGQVDRWPMSSDASRARRVTPLRCSVISTTWESRIAGLRSSMSSTSMSASSETCLATFANFLFDPLPELVLDSDIAPLDLDAHPALLAVAVGVVADGSREGDGCQTDCRRARSSRERPRVGEGIHAPGTGLAQCHRAGLERGSGGGHVVDEHGLRGDPRAASDGDHACRHAEALRAVASHLARAGPWRRRQSATGSPVRRPSSRASRSAWLKPLRRRRRGCSGTGTSATGPSSTPAGAPATICDAIGAASPAAPRYLSARTSARAGPS